LLFCRFSDHCGCINSQQKWVDLDMRRLFLSNLLRRE